MAELPRALVLRETPRHDPYEWSSFGESPQLIRHHRTWHALSSVVTDEQVGHDPVSAEAPKVVGDDGANAPSEEEAAQQGQADFETHRKVGVEEAGLRRVGFAVHEVLGPETKHDANGAESRPLEEQIRPTTEGEGEGLPTEHVVVGRPDPETSRKAGPEIVATHETDRSVQAEDPNAVRAGVLRKRAGEREPDRPPEALPGGELRSDGRSRNPIRSRGGYRNWGRGRIRGGGRGGLVGTLQLLKPHLRPLELRVPILPDPALGALGGLFGTRGVSRVGKGQNSPLSYWEADRNGQRGHHHQHAMGRIGHHSTTSMVVVTGLWVIGLLNC